MICAVLVSVSGAIYCCIYNMLVILDCVNYLSNCNYNSLFCLLS